MSDFHCDEATVRQICIEQNAQIVRLLTIELAHQFLLPKLPYVMERLRMVPFAQQRRQIVDGVALDSRSRLYADRISSPKLEPITQAKIDRVFGLDRVNNLCDKGRKRIHAERLKQRWLRGIRRTPTFEELDKFEASMKAMGFL